MKMKRPILIFISTAIYFLAPCISTRLAAQTGEGMVSLTREEIVAGARKEGRLFLSPGYDKATVPHLVKAFTRKYPFLEVSWNFVTGIAAAQRQLFEMASGKASLDVFSPSTTHWGEYFKQNLIKKYSFKSMARNGMLKIPAEMTDESNVVVWLGTNMGVIAYHSKLVPREQAPKGWESCIDPHWKGKLAVDTKPNTLAWMVPAWGMEKILSFARKLKENDPIWVRGQTGTLARMGAGEFLVDCGMYLHTARRNMQKDPSLPIGLVIPNPAPLSFHEPEAIYAGARNPHAGLLWIEFLASREAQEIIDSVDPGKASFLVEGTIAHGFTKGVQVSMCTAGCRDQEDALMARIAVEAWGLPKVGAAPRK